MSVNPVDTKQRILPVEHPPRMWDLMQQVSSNKLEKMSQCLNREIMSFIPDHPHNMGLMKRIN